MLATQNGRSKPVRISFRRSEKLREGSCGRTYLAAQNLQSRGRKLATQCMPFDELRCELRKMAAELGGSGFHAHVADAADQVVAGVFSGFHGHDVDRILGIVGAKNEVPAR